MIKILAIGNSFSRDATEYLHDIAKQGGIETKVANLYIGGCSLCTHWENAINNLPNYQCRTNGTEELNEKISIREALLSDDWDFITLQQASYDSGIIESYFPYIRQLSDYVKKYAPNAEQLIHQTWAYEIDSTHEDFTRYNNDQVKMYRQLKNAYEKVSQDLGLELIPCGDVIQALRGTDQFDYLNKGQSLCRDGFHMHVIYGRYATAATWFENILDGDILKNNYIPLGTSEFNNELIELIKKTVHNICALQAERNRHHSTNA